MDFIYYSTLSINGFDDDQPLPAGGLLVNTCSDYALRRSPGARATSPDRP